MKWLHSKQLSCPIGKSSDGRQGKSKTPITLILLSRTIYMGVFPKSLIAIRSLSSSAIIKSFDIPQNHSSDIIQEAIVNYHLFSLN